MSQRFELLDPVSPAVITKETESVRDKLLVAAEQLFAENGIAETSVRDITHAAGANVAAINYHFGSRDALLQELLTRRLQPLNAERLRLLAASETPRVEDILAAWAKPSLELCFTNPHFARLASQLRLHTNRSLWNDYRDRQTSIVQHFETALATALPEFTAAEIQTRFHYVLGTIHHIWSNCPLPESQTPEHLLQSFLTFYSAGFHALPPGSHGE